MGGLASAIPESEVFVSVMQAGRDLVFATGHRRIFWWGDPGARRPLERNSNLCTS